MGGGTQGFLGEVLPDHRGVLVSFPSMPQKSSGPWFSSVFTNVHEENKTFVNYSILNEQLQKQLTYSY